MKIYLRATFIFETIKYATLTIHAMHVMYTHIKVL